MVVHFWLYLLHLPDSYAHSHRRSPIGLCTLHGVYTLFVKADGAVGRHLVPYVFGDFLASAVIKRVDSVPIALLILAVMNQGKTRFVFFLGLSVASKHLALFAVPWLFFDRRTTKATLWRVQSL